MASENSGGGKSKIVNANQREDRVPAKPFTQTLNKYGTSDTNSRPVVKILNQKPKHLHK